MSEKTLNSSTYRLAPHRHTHQELVAVAFILALQLGRERRAEGRGLFLHLPASCGLVELVWWWDSNPPPTMQHQAPGTRNDATDASQHGNGPDETSTRG